MDGSNNKVSSLTISNFLPIPETLWITTLVAAFTGLDHINAIIAAIASFWIYWRVKEVIRTPIPDLIKRLGLELPTAPNVSLLDVTDDSVSLHWKTSDSKYSVIKYLLKLNGQCAGEVSQNDTAVVIKGLKPNCFYSLRVVAVNTSNFKASSPQISIRTKVSTATQDTTNNHEDSTTPTSSQTSYKILPIKTLLDPTSSSVVASTATREQASSQPPARRNTNQRKVSGASPHLAHRQSTGEFVPPSIEDTSQVPALTAQLDTMRKEINDLESEDKDEELDYQREKRVLEDKAEALKMRQRERDSETKDLRRRVTQLERDAANALNRSRAVERTLASKRAEREKITEDMKKWELQIQAWQDQENIFHQNRREYRDQTTEKIESLKQEGDVTADNVKELEDQVRERRINLRHLEAQKHTLENSEQELDKANIAAGFQDTGDLDFHRSMLDLQNRQISAQHALTQAISTYQQISQRYSASQARRGSHPNVFQSMNEMPMSAGSDSISSFTNTTPKSQPPYLNAGPLGRSSPNAFPGSTLNDANIATRSGSPWNSNGLNRHLQADTDLQSTSNDASRFSSLPLASPGASLIPQDLLEGDEYSPFRGSFFPSDIRPSSYGAERLSSHHSAQDRVRDEFGEDRILPGLGDIRGLPNAQVSNSAQSPIMQNSRSPSLVSSPHGSIANFHQQKHSEHSIDSDRRSIKSTSSMTRAGQSKRFAGFFGGRSRGRTNTDDGPALGSLDMKHTQSLPRSDAESQDVNPIDSPPQRRFGSSSRLLGNMSSSLLGGKRQAILPNGRGETGSELSLDKPTNFNLFGATPSIWSQNPSLDPANHSRPASTYSADPQGIRPSGDLLGWSGESSIRNSGNFNPWSSHHSRRESLQSQDGVIGDLKQDVKGDGTTEPVQAPIGTKPLKTKTKPKSTRGSISTSDSFMNKFRSEKKSEGKAKKKGKDDLTNADESLVTPVEDAPLSRLKSRSDRASIAESADTSSVKDLDDAETPSAEDMMTPSSANRESFMSKLTRKSSSNRFSMGFSRKKTATGQPAEETDDESLAALGKSYESIANASNGSHENNKESTTGRDGKRGSAFSLSSLKRKKKGTEAPSISEASMTSASATGDEGSSRRPSADY